MSSTARASCLGSPPCVPGECARPQGRAVPGCLRLAVGAGCRGAAGALRSRLCALGIRVNIFSNQMSPEGSERFRYLDSQLHDQWRSWHVLVLCAIILAGGLVGLYVRLGHGSLDFRPDISTEIGGALVSLTILVASVEIAAATIVDIFRAKSYSEWSMRVQRVSERLSDEDSSVEILRRAYQREKHFVQRLYEKQIIPLPVDDLGADEQNREGYRSWLEVARGIYAFALARHAAITRVRVSYVVFVAGFLLAVGGVSVFSFVLMEGAVNNWFDRLLDWLVTGCVIGGGSTRLNGLLSRISELLGRARQTGIVK